MASSRETDAVDGEPKPILWWLFKVFGAVGLIGGPIEIANLFSGLVQWHGAIGFVVEFWNTNIVAPFHIVLDTLVNSLLLVIGLPNITLPTFVSDYITLGILLSASLWRSFGWDGKPLKVNIFTICYIAFWSVLLILFWPVALILFLRAAFPPIKGLDVVFSDRAQSEEKRRNIQLALTLWPFLAFFLFYIVNQVFGGT